MDTRGFKWRKRLRRGLTVGLVLLIVGLIVKDWAAKRIAEVVASSITGGQVEIGDVRLSLRHVIVEDVDIREPDNIDQPQLTVDLVQIDHSLWRGLREGVWGDSIRVERPTLHLRFDHEGQLVSRFPRSEPSESSSSGGPLPFESLAVNDARIVLHQRDREELSIAGMTLRLLAKQHVEIFGLVPDLFGGSCTVHSQFDLTTLAGRTQVHVAPLAMDTHELAKLAVVGPLVENMKRTQATASLDVDLTHPANCTDPRDLTAEVNCKIGPVTITDRTTVLDSFAANVRLADGRIAMHMVGAGIKGTLDVRANCDLRRDATGGTLNVQAAGFEPALLAAELALPDDIAATIGAKGATRFVWDDGKVRLDGKLAIELSKINVQGIAVDPVVVVSNVVASADARQDFARSLAGHVDVSVQSDGLALEQLADRLPKQQVQGRVDLAARLRVPLATVSDVGTYSAVGSVGIHDVVANKVAVAKSRLALQLVDGTAKCWLDGVGLTNQSTNDTTTVQFGVTAQVAPVGELAVQTSVDSLFLQTIAQLVGIEMQDCQGALTARLRAKARLCRASDLRAWQGSGELVGDRLVVAGEPVRDLRGDLRFRDNQLALAQLRIGWRDNNVVAEAKGNLISPTRVAGQLRAGPINLSDVSQVLNRYSAKPLPATGMALLVGNFSADLAQKAWQADGRLDLSELRLAQTEIGSTRLGWRSDPASTQLTAMSDQLLGGSFVASANMTQLDWTQATIVGRFDGIQVHQLVSLAGTPLASTGSLSGRFQVTSIASPQTMRGYAEVTTQGVSLQRVPIESFTGFVHLASGTAKLGAKGSIGGGELTADAEANLLALLASAEQLNGKLSQLPIYGQLRVAGIPLQRIAQVAGQQDQLRPLSGFIHAAVERNPGDAQKGIVASGSASLQAVRWGPAILSEKLVAEFALDDRAIIVQQINGTLAGGRVLGKAQIALGGAPKGMFQVALNRIDLRRLTGPLGKSAPAIAGTADIRLDGRLGSQITGQASVALDRVSVDSLALKRVRVPVTWSVDPRTGIARWNTRDARIEIGGGTVRTQCEGRWYNGLDMTLTAQARRIDTGKLTNVRSSSAGLIDGTVRLRARRADSPNDIVGTFDIKLSQAKAFEMPVLSDMTRLTSFGPSASDGDGTIQGRVGGGIVYLDHMQLSAANARVMIAGTATFAGRLNMDVTASTGQEGPADALLEFADSPIMLAAPAPVMLVAKANKALKNRVVHVQVSGTVANPQLRLNPGKQLGQQAIQFFLKPSYVPTSQTKKL